MSLGVALPHLVRGALWVSALRVFCPLAPCIVVTHALGPCCTCVPLGPPCFTCVTYSLVCWPSSEGTLNWPDLLSDPSIVGSTLQRLARGRLGPEEDGLSLVSPSSPAKSFSASGEQGWGGWYPHAIPGKVLRNLGVEETMPSLTCFPSRRGPHPADRG